MQDIERDELISEINQLDRAIGDDEFARIVLVSTGLNDFKKLDIQQLKFVKRALQVCFCELRILLRGKESQRELESMIGDQSIIQEAINNINSRQTVEFLPN